VKKVNLPGVVGALLILLFRFVFLRKLDVFEPEKFIYLFITLILGMIFITGVFIIDDILSSRPLKTDFWW